MVCFSIQSGHVKDKKTVSLVFAENMHAAWFKCELLWMYIDYEMTAISSVSSMLVVYILASGMSIEKYRIPILIYLIVAAGTALLNYSINPKRQALAYRRAFLIIGNAINHYCIGLDQDPASQELFEAIQSGENEITITLS